MAETFAEPNEETLIWLGSKDQRTQCVQACKLLGIDPRTVRTLLDVLPDMRAWLASFDAMFGHAVRGECPPYELEYAQGMVFQQADALADLAAFYRAFGLTASGPLQERPDHLVAEWEFLAVCAFKEAASVSVIDESIRNADENSSEHAIICRNAQRSFLRDHASQWMPAFFGRVRKSVDSAFFRSAALLGDQLLRCWCEEFGVPVGPEWMELRPIEEDDWKMECGPAGGFTPVELGPGMAAAMECGAKP